MWGLAGIDLGLKVRLGSEWARQRRPSEADESMPWVERTISMGKAERRPRVAAGWTCIRKSVSLSNFLTFTVAIPIVKCEERAAKGLLELVVNNASSCAMV